MSEEIIVYAINTLYLKQGEANWQNCHDSNTGSINTYYLEIGQGNDMLSGFKISRGLFYFDLTGIVPAGALILSAKLYLKPYQKLDSCYRDFDCVIQRDINGDRPTEPPVEGDFYYTYYSGDYGKKNTSLMTEEEYAEIEVTDLSLIVADGMTKFVIRNSNEINNIGPLFECWVPDWPNPDMQVYCDEYIAFYQYDAIESKKPYLVIEYVENPVVNIKAEPDSTQGAIKLYGEILSAEAGTIVERGFEYKIQDNEPGEEDTGTEVKEINAEGFGIGEYSIHEYEGNEVGWEDYLYHLLGEGYGHNTIWWFRAYIKDSEDNKYIAETWMKNIPSVTTFECTNVLAQQATGNGELTDKGANIVTRLGFRIIKEYSGDLMGANSYTREWDGYLVAIPLEEHPIYDVNGIFITGWYWTGIFYRDAFFPKSQTEGNFDLGLYSNILGGGWNGEGFGYYLKPNDTLKIQAIARNDLGIGYGDDIFEITTGQNLLYEADEPIISPTSVEKSVTLRNIPEGAIATRVGIRLGRTSSCNEIDVFENGEWGNDDKVTFFIPGLEPGEKYYEEPYMILHYTFDGESEEWIEGVWDEIGDIVTGSDDRLYICTKAHTKALDNFPITGEDWPDYWTLYEWEEEIIDEGEDFFIIPDWDEDWDYDTVIPTYEEYNYKTVIREIRCEKMSDQSFIDKAGRRRSITLNNHLIQTEEINKEVINAYLEQFQIIKLKVSIDYDIPIPFERGDVILIGEGKHKFKADGEGEIPFKADDEGEIPFANSILAKIRKIDSSFTSGIETILGLELEV
jgi:hypothetical protein